MNGKLKDIDTLVGLPNWSYGIGMDEPAHLKNLKFRSNPFLNSDLNSLEFKSNPFLNPKSSGMKCVECSFWSKDSNTVMEHFLEVHFIPTKRIRGDAAVDRSYEINRCGAI